jgi:hypothetical protein
MLYVSNNERHRDAEEKFKKITCDSDWKYAIYACYRKKCNIFGLKSYQRSETFEDKRQSSSYGKYQ